MQAGELSYDSHISAISELLFQMTAVSTMIKKIEIEFKMGTMDQCLIELIWSTNLYRPIGFGYLRLISLAESVEI